VWDELDDGCELPHDGDHVDEDVCQSAPWSAPAMLASRV
jgi:hypothetical protein